MKLVAATLFGVALGGTAVWLGLRSSPAQPPQIALAQSAASSEVVAAAQGRVEGLTETTEVEASADGVLRSLLVKEGQRVAKGQIIGELDCDNLVSDVRALEAQLESAKQSRVRLLRGSREEERRVAEQEILAAKAVFDQASRQNGRMQYLLVKDDVSQQMADGAKRDLDTARAALLAAEEKQRLVNAGPLPEETRKADADVAAVQEKLRAASGQREKCVIHAPISGTITRVNMRVGEAFSVVLPRPIVTMADISAWRIRAEVDERDILKVRLQQKVRVTVPGLATALSGRVTWTSVVMGRRTAKSRDPAERADRDILEVLIAPDTPASRLPLSLRVVVEFLTL